MTGGLDDAIIALDRAVRQARTPRVRLGKLAIAIQSAEDALAIIGADDRSAPAMAALSDIHRLLIDIRAGLLPYADWRVELQAMVRALMDDLGIDQDDDEEAFALLLMA